MKADRLAERREKLVALMNAHDLDALALVPGASFFYFTGARFRLSERPILFILTRDGGQLAVMPSMARMYWSSLAPGAATAYWDDAQGYALAFSEIGNRLKPARIGLEGQQARMFEMAAMKRAFGDAELVDVSDPLSQCRLVKDDEELANLQEAVSISEKALAATVAALLPGMSEGAVKSRLVANMLELGAERAAFEPTVVSGPATGDPYAGTDSARILCDGGALMIDFGAVFRGYCADITRTFFVGDAPPAHREIHEAVHEANVLGRRLARPGLTAHALDEAVCGFLRDRGFGAFIQHKTGHGLGIDLHEHPHIMSGNRTPLAAGMVITIEPGLYVPGEVGVRIEDDVLITDSGCRSLTAFGRGASIAELA